MTSLAKFLGQEEVFFREVPLSQYAHVIIDAQKGFCALTYTGFQEAEDISKHIGVVTPLFRASGINTVIVRYDDKYVNLTEEESALHNIFKLPSDKLIEKTRDSSFLGTRMDAFLKEKNISHLLLSGFNAGACITDTFFEAISLKYKVALLEDCIGRQKTDPETSFFLKHMQANGAILTSSNNALQQLRAERLNLSMC